MSQPISDEQIQAIERKCERQDDGQFVFGYDEAMEDIATLRQAISERDVTIEDLRDSLGAAKSEAANYERENAELRKPAAVALTNLAREDIESHRETLLSQVLRQIREVLPSWADVDVDVRNDLIHQWRMRLNESAEDLARTHNAWQVAMVERDAARTECERLRKPEFTEEQMKEILIDNPCVIAAFSSTAINIIQGLWAQRDHARKVAGENAANVVTLMTERDAEIQRLQTALAFWLPNVPADDAEIAERAGKDAWLLCGFEGPQDETAQALGWISLRSDFAARLAAAEAKLGEQERWAKSELENLRVALRGQTANRVAAEARERRLLEANARLLKITQGICPACGESDLHSAAIGNEAAISCCECDWISTYAALALPAEESNNMCIECGSPWPDSHHGDCRIANGMKRGPGEESKYVR